MNRTNQPKVRKKRLSKSRITTIAGIVVALSVVIGIGGVLNFYARLDYNVDSGSFLYIDDVLVQETVFPITATLYPGENLTDYHTIRLHEDAPTNYLTVSFTIETAPDDGALSAIVRDDTNATITTLNVIPATESNAQEFNVYMELDPLAESGINYAINITIDYGGIGY